MSGIPVCGNALLLLARVVLLAGMVPGMDKDVQRKYSQRAFSATLSVMFLTHPTVSSEVIKSLNCYVFDDKQAFLAADFRCVNTADSSLATGVPACLCAFETLLICCCCCFC